MQQSHLAVPGCKQCVSDSATLTPVINHYGESMWLGVADSVVSRCSCGYRLQIDVALVINSGLGDVIGKPKP